METNSRAKAPKPRIFEKMKELSCRFRNNDTTHLPVNPIGIVIYETLY